MDNSGGSTSKPPPRLMESVIFTFDLPPPPPPPPPLPAPIKMNQQDAEENQASHNFRFPTRAIKEWVPKCEESLVPKLGLTFDDLEQCEKFYKTYAHHVGFSVRKSSSKKDNEGVPQYKYFVCSKEGFRENSLSAKYKGKEKIRHRKLTRVGCNALIGCKRTEDGKYVIRKFYEGHMHLPATPKSMIKSNSRAKSVHRSLLKSFTHANVGPNKGIDFTKEQFDGMETVGWSREASKDFSRDLKVHVNGSDAHMFVENLKRKQEVNKSFYFAYELNDDRGLKHVFWADGISRRNYASYGDVVSVDTTFYTNRYNMVFVSFTGLDNHRLCVTFGGAFLKDEKAESFIWLFETFLDAMGGHQPVRLLTDQNHAMTLAIQKVLETSTHKYCIWHIMRKLSEKVGCSLSSNVDFSTRFKSCVYNSETPVEFETTWQSIIKDFGLTENDWLPQIYALREMWIPAYFRDLFLGAVLRTTSRSGSEDSFFSNFTHPHLSLVEFWVHLESSIDLQRHDQAKADYETSSSTHQLKTDRDLEKHAAQIYTDSNFYRLQQELWVACMDCEIEDKKETQEGVSITIVDSGQRDGKTRQVIYNPLNHVAHCSCKMFECEGIPCHHILCILKGKVHELPNYYILNRWTKMASSKPFFIVDGSVLGGSQMSQVDRLISENWMQFMTLMQVAGRDPKMLTLVSKRLSSVYKQLMELENNTSESRVGDVDSITCSSDSEPVESLPLRQLNNKVSGKRIKEGKETIKKQRKRKRLCRACGEQAYHDSRNCPSKVSSKPRLH